MSKALPFAALTTVDPVLRDPMTTSVLVDAPAAVAVGYTAGPQRERARLRAAFERILPTDTEMARDGAQWVLADDGFDPWLGSRSAVAESRGGPSDERAATIRRDQLG